MFILIIALTALVAHYEPVITISGILFYLGWVCYQKGKAILRSIEIVGVESE